MKRFIAWDTSGHLGVICAWEWEPGCPADVRLLWGQLLEVDQRQHSEGLFVGIELALQTCGWSLPNLDGLGIGVGPGSFTGVRVGLTAARTFGQMLGIPLVPISSLAMHARELRARGNGSGFGSMIVCRDACMGEVYLRQELPESEPKEWVQKISLWDPQGYSSGGLWLGAPKNEGMRPESWRTEALEPNQDLGFEKRLTRALAEEVILGFERGSSRSALEVYPAYLRAPDAELKLKERLQKNSK